MTLGVVRTIMVGLVVGVGALAASGQTTIQLTSSGADVITFAGNGSGAVTATLGDCSSSQCTMTGGGEGNAGGGAITGYTLNIGQNVALTDKGGGSYSVNSSGLTGSTFSLTNSSNQSVFSGSLAGLTFTDSSNGQVDLVATVDGTGSSSGTDLTVKGVVQLDGANIASVESAHYPTAVSGGIVPEPTTLLLFGTGLIGLGGLLRRRWEVSA